MRLRGAYFVILWLFILGHIAQHSYGQRCEAGPGPRIPKAASEVLRRYSAMHRKMMQVHTTQANKPEGLNLYYVDPWDDSQYSDSAS